MTKKDIASMFAQKSGLDITSATNAVELFTEIFTEAFADGENIYLRGFGTFKVCVRKARPARNISAGTTVMVPEHNTVKFIPSPSLFIDRK